MNWQDIKGVINDIEDANTTSGIMVTVAFMRRGIEIKCVTSCGFFTRTVNRLIPYGEADHAVHLPGMILATATEVRAVMLRDMGRHRGKNPTENYARERGQGAS